MMQGLQKGEKGKSKELWIEKRRGRRSSARGKDLNTTVVSVSNDNVIVVIDNNTNRLVKLTFS